MKHIIGTVVFLCAASAVTAQQTVPLNGLCGITEITVAADGTQTVVVDGETRPVTEEDIACLAEAMSQ